MGNTEITFLQRGSNPMWSSERKGPSVPFPADLLTAFGRAFDPYENPAEANNRIFTDTAATTPAVLGDRVASFFNVWGYNIGSSNTVINATTRNLLSNTSFSAEPRPQLVEHVGRRCLRFTGQEYLHRVNSPMDMVGFNAITVGAVVYIDPSVTSGTIFEISRGEYSANRTHVAVRLNTSGANTFIDSRARFDSASYADMLYSANNAAFVLKPGWRVVWFEWDFARGADSTDGRVSGHYGNGWTEATITTSYGLDAGDTKPNRILVGAALNGGSPPFSTFTGHIGRFFFAMRTFTASERARLEDWLMGTEYVPWTADMAKGPDTWFPSDILAGYSGFAFDTYNPAAMQANTYTGATATANNANVGLNRLISAGFGNSNTAVAGGPHFFQANNSYRPKLSKSWDSVAAANMQRNAYQFDANFAHMEMNWDQSPTFNYPSFLNNNGPQHRYSFAFMRLDQGFTAANAAFMQSPFSMGDWDAHYSVSPLVFDIKAIGDRNIVNTTVHQTTTHMPDRRLAPGWVWLESISEIVNANTITTTFYVNGEAWATSNNVIDPLTPNTLNGGFLGAEDDGAGGFVYAQGSAQIGKVGQIFKQVTTDDRERIRAWAESTSYVGMPFPNSYMDNPFTAFGAAYDPYNASSLSNSSIGATITAWTPTFVNTNRTDGLGVNNLGLSNSGSPSANSPLLASNTGHLCLNHATSRLLIANTAGFDTKLSLEFSCGGLFFIDSLAANTHRGIPWHHYRQSVGTDFISYIGLTEFFTGSPNNFPYVKMTANNSGGANNNVITNGSSPFIVPYAIRHATNPQWHAIIHTFKVSANSGATTVTMKTWLNGIKVLEYTKSVAPWDANAYGKMTRYVVGGQLNDAGNIVANKNWNSFTGRNFWFEQEIETERDAQLLTHWLQGTGYTPIGS